MTTNLGKYPSKYGEIPPKYGKIPPLPQPKIWENTPNPKIWKTFEKAKQMGNVENDLKKKVPKPC